MKTSWVCVHSWKSQPPFPLWTYYHMFLSKVIKTLHFQKNMQFKKQGCENLFKGTSQRLCVVFPEIIRAHMSPSQQPFFCEIFSTNVKKIISFDPKLLQFFFWQIYIFGKILKFLFFWLCVPKFQKQNFNNNNNNKTHHILTWEFSLEALFGQLLEIFHHLKGITEKKKVSITIFAVHVLREGKIQCK